MKKLYLFLCFWIFAFTAKADHLVGGELYYQFLGLSSNNVPQYKITLRFFRNMESNVPQINFETPIVGIYSSSNVLLTTMLLRYERVDTVKSSKLPGCVNANLQSIYEVGYFSAIIDLPDVAGGYTVSWSRCCRTNNVANMVLYNKGITVTAHVPGSDLVGSNFNNSAVFPLKDTVLICSNQSFAIDFQATDVDNDSLSYQFSPVYHGASFDVPNPYPANSIVLVPLDYLTPTYTANNPMGAGVTIDPSTAIISGTVFATGTFIVSVKVTEWRNQKMINEHWKEIQIRVKDCSYAIAALKPEIINCNNFEITFRNEGQSSGNKTYNWDFGVTDQLTDTSSQARPVYKYADTGIYKVKLVVNKNSNCPDSAFATVKVYPGYTAAFTVASACINSNMEFIDASIADYGTVVKWTWNFNDLYNTGSSARNPVHLYTTDSIKNVRLISSSDKGCTDTVDVPIQVFANPLVNIVTPDTTICNGDSLAVVANGTGSFNWLPTDNILIATSLKPVVFPNSPVTYVVTATENNCTTKDSVTVNVLPRDAISIQNELSICFGDSVLLQPTSNALSFSWSPSAGLINPLAKSPKASPLQDQTYIVTANPGGCFTRDTIHLTVRPLPIVDAGRELHADPNTSYQLTATGAAQYKWTPPLGLSNTGVANPLVNLPLAVDSVLYTITGISAFGCTNSATIKVVVNKAAGIFIPSAFTPNGDGRNDILTPIVSGNYELQEFIIFNRWGQRVFKTNRKGEGWDGRNKGHESDNGTFVWTIKVTEPNGSSMIRKGTVVVIR